MKLADSFAKDILPQLSTRTTLSVIDNFERKMRTHGGWAGAVRAGKRITLIFFEENMGSIIRIIKSLES